MKKPEEYKSLDYLKDDIELQKEFIKEAREEGEKYGLEKGEKIRS